ncbi:hypothetical protein [Streptomyces indicus]|uniref:Integral membrane protein n=1 Tax=Streptomyces indicus TaxID=417292 RepID=A0A1G9FVE4_9ACTN|nr:hypothetical protein [Streptomyces indicus]SDK92337.1 hypothetical protein SAMN05421806_11485 [Streptomyces indicus]
MSDIRTTPPGSAEETVVPDAPTTPESPGSWDTRSEEVLAEAALTAASDADAAADLRGAGTPGAGAPGAGTSGAASPGDGSPGVAAPAGAAPRSGAGASRAGDVPAVKGKTRKPGARRGAVDPVKALMHRHRELCEEAVDPLEIAAGLEAHGVTDRTAARFRHRDVFSLAEEMYARASRDEETAPVLAPPAPVAGPQVPVGWAAFAMLPGAVCAMAVAGLDLTSGTAKLVAGLLGALAVGIALKVALRQGPLRVYGRQVPATRMWTGILLTYALLGEGLLDAILSGGPDGPWALHTAPVLGLALAVAPAAWCARVFAVQSARTLAASRGLDDFAAAVRPLLGGVFAVFLAVLTGLLLATGAVLGEGTRGIGPALALGALLLLARLLEVHGFPDAGALLLGAACAGETLALATALGGRLPGFGFLSAPVDSVVAAWGPGAVPVLVCGGAAVVLLAHSMRRLTRASAHAEAVR